MAAQIDVYSEQYKQVRSAIMEILNTEERSLEGAQVEYRVRSKLGLSYEAATFDFVKKVLAKTVRDGAVVRWVEHGKARYQSKTVVEREEAERAANAPKADELLALLAQVQAKIEAGLSVNDAYFVQRKLTVILDYVD